MWIHLLTLGLIDGAGGDPRPTPEPVSSSGGGGRNHAMQIQQAKNQNIINLVVALVASGVFEENK